MTRNNLTLIIISCLISLGLGFYGGYFFVQKTVLEEQKNPLAELLDLRIIEKLKTTAAGEITDISGRKITLTDKEDNLEILVGEETPVFRLVPPESETAEVAEKKEISFEEIKIGDQTTILCQLNSDWSLIGIEVIVSD